MLYQTGYLTILGFNGITGKFTLGIPDDEVREDFSSLMSGLIADKDTVWASEIGPGWRNSAPVLQLV